MSIKIERAAKLSKVGAHPSTFTALLAHLPQSLLETMTSRQIAATVDALNSCSAESKAIAAKDAIENGFIWDAHRNCSVDLVS